MKSAMEIANADVDLTEKPKSNKVFYIMLSFFVVILLVFIVVLFFYVSERMAEKKLFEARMTYFKCLSLCPVMLNEDVEGQRMLDGSCRVGCEVVRQELTEGVEVRNKYLHVDLAKEFFNCFSELVRDVEFDYQSCYDEFFDKYNDRIDLSDYELPDYVVYDLSLDSYNCNEDHLDVAVTYLEGDETPANVLFVLKGTDLSTQSVEYNISLGETESYQLGYDDLGIDFDSGTGNFTTVLKIVGKGIVWQEKASCFGAI